MFTTLITSALASTFLPSPSLTPTSIPTATLQARQLWEPPSITSSALASATICAPFELPSGGKIVLDATSTVTFPHNVLYQPACSNQPIAILNGSLPIVDDRDKFYASVVPLVYVVAGCTFVAWFLFIILLLLPGSYVGITRRRPSRLLHFSPRNFLSYIADRPRTGSSRPWLQKVAAFLVVLALTTVTADTFRYAQQQYEEGFLDGDDLREHVTFSKEVKVIRVISDIFLWLAQIQTLIRLFPRHKEKLIIKWIGFLLILLDIIFSCLNSFYVDARHVIRPLEYQDAISALSYLFQLSMNLLYAAWVLYYSLTKRKYAFFHPLMPSIAIIALFSILSVLVPAVFFLVDIVQPDVSTWGEYFRWLGSAASSIVVWEWVERIEALERDEKKDGILGREIYDEDETDNRTISSDRTSIDGDHGYGSDTLGTSGGYFKGRNAKLRALTGHFAHMRLPRKRRRMSDNHLFDEKQPNFVDPSGPEAIRAHRQSMQPGNSGLVYPIRAVSPIDRKQTTSTGSTVYAVHYHPVIQTPPTKLNERPNTDERSGSPLIRESSTTQQVSSRNAPDSHTQEESANEQRHSQPGRARWNFAANAFRRTRKSPPMEIKNALSMGDGSRNGPDASNRSALVIGRIASMAGLRNDERHSPAGAPTQEPTVIPPPPRGQLWSPDTQTHSPILHQGTPDSVASSRVRRALETSAAQSVTAASSTPAKAAASTARTPTPARLAGGQSAAYDFGNTPSPANVDESTGASPGENEDRDSTALPQDHGLENSENGTGNARRNET